MENKILEFVREFNIGLENNKNYNNIQYETDGFNEAISLPKIYLWDDNYSSDYFRTFALGNLTKQLYELQVVANDLLVKEVSLFFALKRELMKAKFPKAKLKYRREDNSINYFVTFSGEYDEEQLEEFGEVVQEDFKHQFEGLKISDIWYD